jgi:catechol-2,3-dioxygenase
MDLSIQTSLINVSNLDRSLEFYKEVFEFTESARGDQVAALMISESQRRQVLVLREVSGKTLHPGTMAIGLRLFALEAGSLDELHIIEQRLVAKQAFVGRGKTEAYEAIVGVDPDRVKVSIAASLTGLPIRSEDWHHLDDMVYGIAE